jgi:autotransporter translocation and assembly factor TamB
MRTFAFFASLSLLACLMVTSALAADVSGKWTAQMPGRQGNTMEVTFNFKADGNTLTGTVSNPRGEAEIKDGKIDGDNISFTQTFDRGGNSMTIVYKGKVNGDTIEFTRSMQGREGQGQPFTAKRAK